MSLYAVLNLSRPRVVAFGVAASFSLVALLLWLMSYNPPIWDSCAGATVSTNAADAPFTRVAEKYLQETRNMSSSEYCIVKQRTEGDEHIVMVFRSGQRVGGGEGFQVRIDLATMTVIGELPRE